MKNQNVRLAACFIVGVLVGLGIYWLATRSSSSADKLAGSLETASSTENTLSVTDQVPGNKVVLARVTITDPSWIAIRDNVDGKPGPKVLGAQLFNESTKEGTVALLRDTVEGKSYFALIYKDDGDRQFGSKTDTVVTDENNIPYAVNFTATNSALPEIQPEATSTEATTTDILNK